MTGYRLYRDNDYDGVADVEVYPGNGDPNNPTDTSLRPTVTTLSYPDGGLTTGTVYGYKVRAYNARGYTESAWLYVKSAAEPAKITTVQQNNAASSATSISLTQNNAASSA